MNERTRRNSLRLAGFDYSRAGVYFITICVKNSEPMLSNVKNGKMQLNERGQVARNELINTANHLKFELIEYVIMPNHVHFLAAIFEPQPVGAAITPPEPLSKRMIPKIVQGYKAAVTRKVGFSLWQRSYFDSIVRDNKELQHIQHYIQNNPATWEKDQFFCK
ncbi:MAG: transposase [Oscillospiraceae bacterium]|nr:transposase [Oscillospiraceae bacterium]